MLLVEPDIFMSWFTWLIFDIQWPLVHVKIEMSSLSFIDIIHEIEQVTLFYDIYGRW
jgi:hypothetical protein